VYPASSAVPLNFDENGACSGCRVADQKARIDWDKRRRMFERLIEEYRAKDGKNYDCLIPVSGGKDSYFQVHIIKKVWGLNPLLVTYHGNNYTETGMQNLINMREIFEVDHIFFTPSIGVLKKLNRICFRQIGDMNWHAHCGIFTYPIRVAVGENVPLMIWGEHGFMDLGGMHSYSDFVEFTYRHRHEHSLRGYEWYDFLEEGLTEKDLLPFQYPSDEEIERVGVRGIYLSNYFPWDANNHAPMVIEKYGFKVSPTPFDRTYRRMSNLDDMHENGVHDYLKYIKFGYGRATDHACKDIRAGKITREEGIELVRKYDHRKPSDLKRWLAYVGMAEEEFDRICDTFRDPRVWWKDEKGNWCKDNIWDEA
jgi:N-acetyl sugar amidotransferase